MRPIVLLTDFGEKDGFAGVLKGVILSVNPSAFPIDLTHYIDSFDILGGALVLKAHYRYFPKGSIFVGVVDPGVGTERKAIAVKTKNYFFVGPMNGLFDLVLKEEKPLEVVELTNPKYRLKAINNTFHGRDIFAPAAAYISKGIPLRELGKPIKYRFLLDFPKAIRKPKKVIGQIVYFDNFGNAITNIPCSRFKYCIFRGFKAKFVKNFLSGSKEKPNSICGSFGFVELFIPKGSFKEVYKSKRGEKVICFY